MKKLVLVLLGSLLLSVLSINVFANGFTTYTVERGDTPATIAQKTLKDPGMFPLLMRYNNITSPDQLTPGTEIRIPFSVSQNRRARVNYVSGQVQGREGEGKPVASLSQGDVLLENHQIRTGNDGRIELVLDEGSVVRIGPNTNFVLKGYNYGENANRNTNVGLSSGSMTMRVTRLTQDSQFNVSTVTAVAGVRGTFFYVNFDEESQDVGIAVYSGAVAVQSEERPENNVTVDSGYATVVRGGEEVESPFPIPGQIKWLDEE